MNANRREWILSIVLLGCSVIPSVGQEPEGWTSSQLVGTGSPPLPYQVVEAFPGLVTEKAVDLDCYPEQNGDHWILTELGGRLWVFSESNPAGRKLVLENADASAPGKGPQGRRLYSSEFDPAFPDKPWIYLSSNKRVEGKGTNRIARFALSQLDPPVIDPDSEVILLEWTSTGHDGCDLKFGPDGMLYASTGDGEPPGDPGNVGQTVDNLLGSMLRIDVSDPKPDQPYRVPEDNPFIDKAPVPPEVWAYGFRNPWRMTFHPDSGELFLGDNGDENWELVRRVTAGTNHGWSAFEGSYPFRLSTPLAEPVTTLTVPVYEHPHTEMRSVIGGVFYRGDQFPELRDRYVYGCYFTRKVWAFDWDGEKATNPRRIANAVNQIVSFAEDDAGEILIVTHDGPVYRLAKPEKTEPPKPVPEALSATGLFSKTTPLKSAPGVIPYEINAESWADGLVKQRHFGMLSGETAEVRVGESQNKSWRFPNGSAFALTFSHESGQPIETQVIHKDEGEWQFLTYAWRDDRSDADLVPAEGTTKPYQIGDQTLSHRFASRAECTACHTQRTFFVNAMSTEQLNRHNVVQAYTYHQFDRFEASGLFRPNQQPKREKFPPLADPYDEDADLDARARAYLHINCAHCHRESGLGGRAQFQLMHWLTLEETGAVNALPLIGLPGAGDVRVIAPGYPDRSEIVRRMEIRGPNQMPLIGSHQVDEAGVALIREWISSLSTATTDESKKEP